MLQVLFLVPTLKLVSLVNYFVDLETSLSGIGLGVGWYREARGHWTQGKYEVGTRAIL